MKVVSPSVEIITESNPLKRIELCGRVCYKSEDKITETSANKFVQRIMGAKHNSVLEHFRLPVYPGRKLDEMKEVLTNGNEIWTAQIMGRVVCHASCVTVNARDYFELFKSATVDDLAGEENADDYMTVRFICDRGIANELVRHRVCSFSQESTRYVNYKEGVTFVEPLPYVDTATWVGAMYDAEAAYREMIENGATPQEARNVLPLSTKTELIMTGTLSQWEMVLRLRTAKGAHPQMVYLMHRLAENENFPEELKGVVYG
jgi:thymidylate synthase ThyX